MKKFDILRVIKNKRYSPKEALVYFVITSRNVTDVELESYIISLKEILLRNINNKKILEKLNLKLLEKITNYWSLTIEELIAYGYIVFNNLIFEKKEITEKEITNMFVYAMRLYSPNNAKEFIKDKLKE